MSVDVPGLWADAEGLIQTRRQSPALRFWWHFSALGTRSTGYYGYSLPCPLYPRSPAEPEPVPAEVEDERAGAEREEPDIDLGLP